MVRVRVLGWLRRVGRDPQRELREFKDAFEQASRDKDREAIERMMHPDFSMVTPDGDLVGRRGVINGIVATGSSFMPHYDRRERVTTFSASGDLVREIADLRIAGEIPGRGDLGGEYTHSAIFIHTARGWQFFGNTLTRKVTAPRPAAATASGA